jgi:hypothetical protein
LLLRLYLFRGTSPSITPIKPERQPKLLHGVEAISRSGIGFACLENSLKLWINFPAISLQHSEYETFPFKYPEPRTFQLLNISLFHPNASDQNEHLFIETGV